MKRFVLVLLAAALAVTMAGCTPGTREDQQVQQELQQWLDEAEPGTELTEFSVIKRLTDKQARSDTVYVQVQSQGPAVRRSAQYEMLYRLYNEGWILDEVKDYRREEWTVAPLAGPDEETVAAVLPEGAELLSSQFDADAGVQTVQYRVSETHPYCDMERTEQVTMTLDSATEQWLAGEPELLEQDQDWTRLLGFWELEGYDNGSGDDLYEMEIAVLPFEQAQLDGLAGYVSMGANRKRYSTADITEDDTSVVKLSELLEPVEGETLPTFRSTLGDDSLFRLDPDDGLVYIWQGRPDQEAAMELYQLGQPEGTAGGITWSMDTDWTLTIGGTGPLPPSDDGWEYTEWEDNENYLRLCSTLVVQPGITSIAGRALWNSWFTSATLPEGLESIGERAFYGCDELTDIQLPEGLTEIGERAFARTALTSVVIPDSVKYIGDGAFAGCERLEHIQLPEGVRLGEDVFEGCTALQDLPEPTPTAPPAAEEADAKALAAPMSEDEKTALQLVGSPVADLYEAIGQPESSSYTASLYIVDGLDGALVYDGFIVNTTIFASGAELVMGIG